MPVEEHIQYLPEPPGVDSRVILWCALAALLLLAAAIGVFYAVYDYGVPVKTVPLPEKFPQPRVVTSQADRAELQRLRAEQSRRLETWGWADPNHTLIQIPIERAMQVLQQKGGNAYAPLLPPQPALASPTAAAQNATTPIAPAASGNRPAEKQP
jgi:hypothetical protein